MNIAETNPCHVTFIQSDDLKLWMGCYIMKYHIDGEISISEQDVRPYLILIPIIREYVHIIDIDLSLDRIAKYKMQAKFMYYFCEN